MSNAAAQPQAKRITLDAPVSFTFAQGTDDKPLPAKWSGVAYSGAPIPGRGFVIDLSSTKLAATMPLLDSHMPSEIIGTVDGKIANNQIDVSGELFSDVSECSAPKIARLAQRGAPFQMSVGLFDYRELFVPQGQKLTVNGKSVAGPIVVLQHGTVREVSVVTLGADPNTSTQFFGQTHQGDTTVELAQLTADVARLTAELATANAEKLALQKKIDDGAKDARKAAIVKLAKDTGETIPEPEQAVYLAMPQDAFDAMSGRMLAQAARFQKIGGKHLTQDVATGNVDDDEQKVVKLNASDIYAKRAAAAAKAA